MPRSSASPLVLHLLAASALGDGVPEWVHLIPKDQSTVDGRKGFRLGTETVKLMGFDGEAGASRVPVDINHATAKRGSEGYETPAKGWIVELQARADGIWGRVEWTEAGRALIADKAYRGLSPEIMVRSSDGVIVGIRGASLTNTPNYKSLQPLFHTAQKEDDDMEKLLKELQTALGLADSADQAAIIAAIGTLKKNDATMLQTQLQAIVKAAGISEGASYDVVLATITAQFDPAKSVPAAQVAELQAQLQTVTQTMARDKATAFVDGAIKAGRVGIKPLRDHYIARHMQDAAAVEKELTALPMMAGTTIRPAAPEEGALSAEEETVARMMGVDPKLMKETKAAIAAQTGVH